MKSQFPYFLTRAALPISGSAALALFIFLSLGTANANADTITVFDATGAFQNGATLSGTLDIDVTAGDLTAADLMVSAPDSMALTYILNQGSGGDGLYFMQLTTAVNEPYGYAFVYLPVNSLIGYSGGPVDTRYTFESFAPDINGSSSISTGQLTPEVAPSPEPATILLAGSALLAAGIFKRRRNRLMRLPSLATALLACSWLGLGGFSARADTIDQQYSGGLPPSFYGGPVAANFIDIAQTFTVGLGGTLTGVDVAVARTADTTQPLEIEVRPVVAGLPASSNGSILASTEVPVSQIASFTPDRTDLLNFISVNYSAFSFVHVDLSSANLAVTPGEQLALTLQSGETAGGYAWAFGFGDPGPYADGQGYYRFDPSSQPDFNRGGADQYFRTYVGPAVPEPATFFLVFPALAAAALVRRSRRALKIRQLLFASVGCDIHALFDTAGR